MIFVVSIVCMTAIVALRMHQEHELTLKAGHSRLDQLEKRVSDVEHSHFDLSAFNDLQSKVEAMRLAQGIRR